RRVAPAMTVARGALVGVGFAVLGHGGVGWAQAPAEPSTATRDRAASMFNEGRSPIFESHQNREGVARCEEAYAIYPTLGALARLGACYEWAGLGDQALDAYRRSWRSTDADANVRQFAARAIERIT